MSVKTIEQLYKKIPGFRCKEGCTDCCGPVPFSKSEWDKVTDKRKPSILHPLTCPYSFHGKCDIYEQRPFMCRIFGTSIDPKLRCPHGCGPEKLFTKKQATRLTVRYIELKEEEG